MLENRFALFNKHLISQGTINPISLLDIGGAHSLDLPWSLLKNASRLIRYSYDPFYNNQQEHSYQESETIYPFIVGSGNNNRTNLYNCSMPSMSSCFPPNDHLNKKLLRPIGLSLQLDSHLRHCTSISQDIECVSIDQHFKINNVRVDMLKIDTQGSEFDVLLGAREYINAHSPLIIAETWTIERYKNIALMHKVMGLAYDLGYIPASISLASSAYWLTQRRVCSGSPTPSGYDILFVPLDRLLSCNLSSQVVAGACLLLELFGQRSLGINILEANSNAEPKHSYLVDCMYGNSQYEQELPDDQRNFFGLHY